MCLMRMTTRSETPTKEVYSNGLVIYNEGYTPTVVSSSYDMLGVSAYTGDGTFYEDNIRERESGIWGNRDFYEGAECYEYYLDDDSQWWRCDTETHKWQKWINVLGWHWSEVLYHEEPSNIAQQMYKDNPTLSLDSNTTLVVAMASLVALAGIFKVVSGNRLKSKKVPL